MGAFDGLNIPGYGTVPDRIAQPSKHKHKPGCACDKIRAENTLLKRDVERLKKIIGKNHKRRRK